MAGHRQGVFWQEPFYKNFYKQLRRVKMDNRLVRVFVVFTMILCVSVIPGVVLAGGLTYEGSSTIGENIMPEATKAFDSKTKIKFTSIGNLGSGKGFKAVMEGKADIGGLSRALTHDEKKLKPYYQNIGYDAIAVFVNEKNQVKSLSKEQIKGIFTGKITNWKEVGGADAKIVVVTEIKTGERATIKAFKEMALDDAEFGPTKEVDKPHECVKAVSGDEFAITHASLAFKGSGVRVVTVNKVEPSPQNIRSGAYLLSRPLLLISKELPSGDKKAFFDFMLSGEGQSFVGKNFVTVK
jgi:phosphate transport system substrate-binding protein